MLNHPVSAFVPSAMPKKTHLNQVIHTLLSLITIPPFIASVCSFSCHRLQDCKKV